MYFAKVSLFSLLIRPLQIYAGQRYSFVLNATEDVDNYCMPHCSVSTYLIANIIVIDRDSRKSLGWHDRLHGWHQLSNPTLLRRE